MRRLLPILAVMALAAGCAARTPTTLVATPPPLTDLVPILDRGCYRCFEEAYAIAWREQQHGFALEAALLAALRSKELGMPADDWMARAREAAGTDAVGMQLVEMVAAVTPDVMSGEREAAAANPQERLRIRKLVPSWRERLAAGAESAGFRRYLEKALVCEMESAPAREAFVAQLGTGLSPLLEFAASTCGYVDEARIRPLVEGGFVDGEYALARWTLEGPKDLEQALRRFRVAAEAFPSSLSIPTYIGNVFIEWEEWQSALEAYDRVLAVKPRHPDALLGRTQAVSRLGRYQEGIDTATRLIDGGTWFLGPAHYWRAWNHQALKNHTTARAEMARTKQLMVNDGVFLLSGIIEWELLDRPSAETEFQEAIKMNLGQCEAAFYLGGVRAELRSAEPAIAGLRQALQCYDLSNISREVAIKTITASTASETTKARQIAAHQRAIAHNDQRKGQATKLIGQLEAYIAAEAARQKAAPSAPAPPPAPAQTPSRPARR